MTHVCMHAYRSNHFELFDAYDPVFLLANKQAYVNTLYDAVFLTMYSYCVGRVSTKRYVQ